MRQILEEKSISHLPQRRVVCFQRILLCLVDDLPLDPHLVLDKTINLTHGLTKIVVAKALKQ